MTAMLNSFKSSIINKFFLFILFLTIIFPSIVFADGGIIYYDLFNNAYMLNETDQVAYINHDNETQKMIIAVNANSIKSAKSILWLFPLPASPEKIKIDIINKLPNFYGNLLNGHFLKNYDQLTDIMYYSQLFRFIIYAIDLTFMELNNDEKSFDSIHVFQHVEKLGLATELISAKNSDSLEAYLAQKKLTIPPRFKKLLGNYIDREYSFVASYISDPVLFNQMEHQLGIYVTFPTSKMFFPLQPTSIYGQSEIPIKIYALNYVNPETYNSIASTTKIKYCFNNDIIFGNDFNDFFFNKNFDNKLKYTIIEINSPSNRFLDDLWISSYAIKPYIFQLFVDYYYLAAIIIWLLTSCISSTLAACIAFNDTKFNDKLFFKFGVFNLLSLFGVIIMAYVLRIDIKFTDLKNAENKLPLKKIIIQTLLLSICFLILTSFSVRTIVIIFSDMGDAKLPFLLNLLINNVTAFYVLMFIFALFIFGLPSYIYYKNPRLALFITSFTIFFHSLTGLLSHAINNVF